MSNKIVNHAESVRYRYYKAMKIISKYKHSFSAKDWLRLIEISGYLKEIDFKK
jgi:hypothetical protein